MIKQLAALSARDQKRLRWTVLGTAASILVLQLFVPPIVGLADQGDYRRIIGRFGYGPVDKSEPYLIAFVPRKFSPDPSYRLPAYEHTESEYLFVGSAVWLNKLISKDGELDIEVIGLVHALVFLAAFARLLSVTSGLRWAPFVWIAALLVLTDVGYVAYWNSFYAEPASCLFFLLLLAEGISISRQKSIGPAQMARWSLYGALFVFAKSQNFPLALLLAPLTLRFGALSMIRSTKYIASVGATVIVLAATVNGVTVPKALTMANCYDTLFLAILPESKTPAADLAWFHLDPQMIRYSGTGAWSPGTAFPDLVRRGVLSRELTPITVARFWLTHPGRIWRRAKAVLPIAFSLRPEWCGNFERIAGLPPRAKSSAFSLWSWVHEEVITKIGKFVIILLLLSPFGGIATWIRLPRWRRQIECVGVLSTCCLMAFLVAICSDAWDNVKHLFLFNLLLDALIVMSVTFAISMPWQRALDAIPVLLNQFKPALRNEAVRG